jgi:hypothetical protein
MERRCPYFVTSKRGVKIEPIDAVISWVDGYDPVYQHKLKSFCDLQGINQHIAVEPTRIQQVNEIYYCLQALCRFAPWIRTIYIVTNQQIPPAIAALSERTFKNKIKIVDQNDLLMEAGAVAPVFNSLSIEWLIWRIKGLSNQFIYLNDDFFIIRDVTPDDFFRDGRMVLRGEWKTQSDQKRFYRIKKRIAQWIGCSIPVAKTNPHRAWQEKSAQLAGWRRQFYLLPHAPFPLIKETFATYLADKPQLLAENIRYPFRHPEHISSIPLMVHLDIKQKRIIYDCRLQTVMVNGATHSLSKIQSRLHRADKNKHVAFVCMQSIDQATPEAQSFMLNWLHERFG